MGAVIFPIRDFYDQSSELVGIKSGILLSDFSINKILKEKFDDSFLEDSNSNNHIRLRVESIEEMIRYIRIRIGNIPKDPEVNYYRIIAEEIDNPEFLNIHNRYFKFALHIYSKGQSLTYPKLRNEISKEKLLTTELIDALVYTIMQRLDNNILLPESRQLDGLTPLESLFKMETFPQSKNTFIDQKFIDYLAVNGNEIEEIHWRNFERFVAEYFNRQNFTVILGPGTNDGGIDIRVYNQKENNDPFILIQCKRYKKEHKVTIETVKAFHADVNFENAQSGLIATTSMIATGGKKIVTARDYNISFAENENIKNWATSMWDK